MLLLYLWVSVKTKKPRKEKESVFVDFTWTGKERTPCFVIHKQTVFRHPKAPMVYTYTSQLSTTLSSHIWDLHISKIFFCWEKFLYIYTGIVYTGNVYGLHIYWQCVLYIVEMYSNMLRLRWEYGMVKVTNWTVSQQFSRHYHFLILLLVVIHTIGVI